jgi:hypothetical protein
MASEALTWTEASSADDEHDDQDTDLALVGNPAGASWAGVSDEGDNGWHWGIYSRWLWEDIDADPNAILAEGYATSQQAAKDCVVAWLSDRATTYRTERYDTAWAGWRCDDVELRGVTAKRAHDAARDSTKDSTIKRRVVNETTGETVATYTRGRKR